MLSVDVEYIDRIYGSLTAMDISLDVNPIEYGPGRLNKKIAQVRALLSQTEKIFMEVSHNLAKFKRDLLRSETEYKLLQTNLMATDPHVRSGRSQGEREALASTRLMTEQETINSLTLSVHDLEDALKVIKAKRADLKDIQGRLRDQLKLCQEQISLGQRWGVKVDVNITGETVIQADSSLREEDAVIEEIFSTRQSNLKKVEGSSISSDEIDAFLNTPTEQMSVEEKVDDFDLDSLFDDFSA
jgi:hypothetical protein